MQRPLHTLALLAGVLIVGWLLAACNGGGGAEPTVADPTAAEPPAVETTEPTEAPAAPRGAGPFESFHYTVDLALTIFGAGEDGGPFISGQVEGDFVAPDSHAFTSTFELAGLSGTQEVVIIDDDAWIREGAGDWTHTTIFDPDIQDAIGLTSADPEFLQDQGFAQDIAILDSEAETINGVETRRYHVPKEAVQALVDLLGEDFLEDAAGLGEFEMTVWLEKETGMLVRAELTASVGPDLLGEGIGLGLAGDGEVGISMVVNVTQINDPDIAIEPPI